MTLRKLLVSLSLACASLLFTSAVDAQESSPSLRYLPLAPSTDANSDRDCDGLTDLEERTEVYENQLQTSPNNWDSDFDGTPDGTELGRTRSPDARCGTVRLDADPNSTTSPVLADTDGDGLRDGEEDTNANGRHDEDETDPARPNSPEGAPEGAPEGVGRVLPEPMTFDLVRGLRAHAGEVEANVVGYSGRVENARSFSYAPELEIAFADGYAFEIELPFHDENLEAIKLGLQGTIAEIGDGTWVHGWQVLAEWRFHDQAPTFSALHVSAGRPLPWLAIVNLWGAEGYSHTAVVDWSLLMNSSVYGQLGADAWLGVEVNARIGLTNGHDHRVRIIPQVHVDVAPHVRFQLGLGAEFQSEQWSPFPAGRVIAEL